MKIQVKKDHYDFLKYNEKHRFMSYYYQLKLIYESNPSTILEIGVGSNFIGRQLVKDFKYTSLDIDRALKPNVVGSVINMPFQNDTFDLVVCFQTLEHLPFKNFQKALEEIKRVSKRDVIISLPYANNYVSLRFNCHKINFNFNITVPKFYKKHVFDGQHYWEIGKRNYSKLKFKKIIEKHFVIKKTLNPPENKYHLFYVLEKNSK
jgi:ubiquinone/menaquinone biosynthesis C-methylase UbiE